MPQAMSRTPLASDAALSRACAPPLLADFRPLDVSLIALDAKDVFNPFFYSTVLRVIQFKFGMEPIWISLVLCEKRVYFASCHSLRKCVYYGNLSIYYTTCCDVLQSKTQLRRYSRKMCRFFDIREDAGSSSGLVRRAGGRRANQTSSVRLSANNRCAIL